MDLCSPGAAFAGTELHPVHRIEKMHRRMPNLRSISSRNASVHVAKNPGRRRFIRNFLLGTATSTFLGRGWVSTVLADCQPAQPGEGILRVRISDFSALQNVNGSVRLALNSFTQNGPFGAFYPILINRGANSQFFSLSAQCMHQGCVVPTFNSTFGASVCPCHGTGCCDFSQRPAYPSPSFLNKQKEP